MISQLIDMLYGVASGMQHIVSNGFIHTVNQQCCSHLMTYRHLLAANSVDMKHDQYHKEHIRHQTRGHGGLEGFQVPTKGVVRRDGR